MWRARRVAGERACGLGDAAGNAALAMLRNSLGDAAGHAGMRHEYGSGGNAAHITFICSKL
eukprot:379273-Prymnesium_polylepis.1